MKIKVKKCQVPERATYLVEKRFRRIIAQNLVLHTCLFSSQNRDSILKFR